MHEQLVAMVMAERLREAAEHRRAAELRRAARASGRTRRWRGWSARPARVTVAQAG